MTHIHIAGANGFPANTYIHLFETLNEYQCHYLNLVAHPYTQGNFTWHSIVDEIIQNIEATATQPVIGFGHSMGAVNTYLASLKRPDLFSRLILIEPVIFRPFARKAIDLTRIFIKSQHSGRLAKQALKRKDKFISHAEAHEYFSKKKLFKYFTEKALSEYIEHGLEKNADGYQLRFDKRVESRIFSTIPTKIESSTHSLPTHILFGQQSNLLTMFDKNYWESNFGQESIIFNPGSHLFPFENSDIFLGIVNALIKENKTAIQQHRKLYPPVKRFA